MFDFTNGIELTQGADAMLCTQELPELCADLIATLPHLRKQAVSGMLRVPKMVKKPIKMMVEKHVPL